MLNYRKLNKRNYISILISLTALLAIFICRWEVAPYLQKISDNFSYSANVFSVDNFYDETEKRFSGEVLSVTKFSYDAVKKDQDGDLLIRNIFDVRKPSGEKIFSVERLYAINPNTGSHVHGKGDRNRYGYLFAPRNIRNKEDFVYWHINYNAPALMKFQGEEEIAGLKVYHYQCAYKADQTKNLSFLPGVPKERGVALTILLETWIDPVTGWLIKYEDHTTAWYYDVRTHQHLHPWNKFHNEFAQSSILNQVEVAKNKQQQIKWVKLYLPVCFGLIALMILSFRWLQDKHKKVLLPVFTSFLIFITVSGISFWFYNFEKNLQQEKYLEQFETDSDRTLAYIKSELSDCSSALDILRYDYQEIGGMDRTHFKQLAHHLSLKSDNIGFGYAPVVKDMERNAYEQLARKEGHAGFTFTERNNRGELVRAAKRSVYIPVYFIEPSLGNEKALGYDLLSDSTRQNAINLAKQTTDLIATEPVMLVQVKEKNRQGIIIFDPVFSPDENGSLKLSGYFSGVYVVDNLVMSAISAHDVNKKMKLKILDVTGSNKQLVFSNADVVFKNDLLITKHLPFLNRKWEFNFYLAPMPTDVGGIAILITGIVFAFITAVLTFLILGSRTKELKESNERFFTIFDNNPVGMVITNLETQRFEFANETFLRTMGYTKEEILSKTSLDVNFISPETREKLLTKIKEEGNSKDAEILVRKKNGETFWALSSIQKLKIKDTAFWLNSLHDISKRKEIEDDLNQSRELFSNLFNHNPAAISIRRIRDDKTIDVNNSHLNLFGFQSKDEVIGKTASDVNVMVDPAQIQEIKELLGKNKFVKDYEVQVRTKYGDKKWLSTSIVIIEIDNEPCVLAVSIDITERKKMVIELSKAKQIAEEAVILKETFLANMSHEIRTPMNAIIGFTDLLLKKKLPSQEMDYVQTIKTSGENLLRIINDILDVSKINSGMMTFEEHPISINELFYSLNSMLLPKAREKRLELHFEYDPHIPECLLGDPTRLSQIILNLVGNAIKFTKEGGVQVFAKVLKEEAETCYIEFSITDSGIGIPEDKLKFIFERFSQAESHTTRNYGGTGLGLSIAKQLVKLQDGTIDVRSKIGEGSVFSFTLPFRKTDKAYSHASIHRDELEISDLSKLAILLVEDNPINVKFILSLFSDYQIKSTVAENGRQAVEKIRNHHYDLVLMDIEMPEMNGFEATAAIRNELKSKVPIIALTANAMAGEGEKCLLVGMDDYMSKPININLLFEKMLALASLRKQPEAATPSKKRLIDLGFLVQTLNGKKEVIRETIDLFLEHVPKDLEVMQEAIAKADYTTIKSIAHKMKSTMSLMGSHDITSLLEEMEILGSTERNMEKIITLNQSLGLLCAEAMQEIARERLNYQ
jgi:PAS domain S-box-containing protein